MNSTACERGAVVRGPDLFSDYEYRPYVCLSDDTRPFRDEEAVYTPLTTTQRPIAISISEADFVSGGVPRDSFVNPWTLVTIDHADMDAVEGQLVEATVDEIAQRAADYIGVSR